MRKSDKCPSANVDTSQMCKAVWKPRPFVFMLIQKHNSANTDYIETSHGCETKKSEELWGTYCGC